MPFVGLRISNIMEPDDYAAFPGYWDDPTIRRWNLWGYVDVRDVAQAVRSALEADVDGAEVCIVAAADTVMTRPSAELMAEVFPDVPLRRAVERARNAPLDRARPPAARLRARAPLVRPRGRAGRLTRRIDPAGPARVGRPARNGEPPRLGPQWLASRSARLRPDGGRPVRSARRRPAGAPPARSARRASATARAPSSVTGDPRAAARSARFPVR